jgi:hypothetical protein
MDISITTKEVEYVPEWNENRKEKDPIKIRLRFLNNSQRSDLIRWKADSSGQINLDPDRRGLILTGVTKIENLWIVEDGIRKEIKSGMALLQTYGLEALMIELATEIIGMNPRQEAEKNS